MLDAIFSPKGERLILRPLYLKDMKDGLTKQEKEFILRLKGNKPKKTKIAAIVVPLFLVFGLVIDDIGGFHILRNVKSVGWAVAGLIILSLFYLIGEAGSQWINSKDDVSQPLHKRVFSLFILLSFIGVIAVACWYLFRLLRF